MEKLLNLRLALVVLAAILGAFGLANAFVAIFVRADYEVIYRFEVTSTYCAGDRCAYSAMLEVANTGRGPQPEVTVGIDGLPPGLGGSPWVLNLSAADPRDADPVIEQRRLDGVYVVRLTGFAPGTLAQFAFQGSVPREQLAGAQSPVISITGLGRMIEGDPRAITLARWFG